MVEKPARMAPVSGKLAMALGLHGVLIQVVLAAVSPGRFGDTTLGWVKRWVRMDEASDSWFPMFAAHAYSGSGGSRGRPLYREMIFERGIKFQYPPSALLAVPGLKALMGRDTVPASAEAWRPETDTRRVLHGGARWVSWSFVPVTALFAALLLVDRAAGKGWRESRREAAVLACLAAGFTLTFYPLLRSYGLGQIQTWVTAMLAAALWLWMKGREKGAGALTALACLIKPTYAPLLVWAALRRRWGFLLSGTAVAATVLAVSVGVFGWAAHADYLGVLSHLAERGESYYANQSMNGLLNRLAQNGEMLKFDGRAFPPYHAVVHTGTMISSALLLGGFLGWSVFRRRRPSALEFALGLLTVTMTSPIAWEHHYGVLIAIYALAAPAVLAHPNRKYTWLLLASFLLTASVIAPAKRTADLSWGLNVALSHLYIGALLLLLLLYRLVPAGRAETERGET